MCSAWCGSVPVAPNHPSQGSVISASVIYTVVGSLPLFLVGALAVQLQRDLSFDRGHLGIVISAYFLSSALLATPLGHYMERLGSTRGMRLAAAASFVSLVGIGLLGKSWLQVAAFLALGGLANASAQVASNLALAGGVRSGRQGIAFGLKQSAVPAASVAAGIAVPTLGLTLGWRPAFVLLSIVCAATAFAVPRMPVHSSESRNRSRLRVSRSLGLLVVAAASAGAAGNSLASFTVDAAVASGITEGNAGLLLAVGSATAIAARLGFGYIVDRRHGKGFMELATLMLAAGPVYWLLAASGSSPPLLVLATLAAFATAWGWQGLVFYVVVRAHPDRPAAATGVVMSGVYLGTIIGPAIIGVTARTASYAVAWLISSGLVLVGGLAVLLSLRLEVSSRHGGAKIIPGTGIGAEDYSWNWHRSGWTGSERGEAVNDRALIRYGAAFGLVGALLGVVGNLLHPRVAEMGPLPRFELIADSGIWNFIHWLIGVALILTLGSFVALDRFLRGKPGEPWARLGLVAAIASAAVGIVLVAMDGWTLKTLADEWSAAGRPADGAVFAALNATEQIVSGVFNAFIGSLIGVTPVLLGIAVFQSALFPPWAGILAVASGALGIAVDLIQSMGELTNLSANILFTLAAFGVTVSAIVVNVSMLRATAQPVAAGARAVPAK